MSEKIEPYSTMVCKVICNLDLYVYSRPIINYSVSNLHPCLYMYKAVAPLLLAPVWLLGTPQFFNVFFTPK